MEELEQLEILMRLKEVYREGFVRDRKESSAEHVWGCMILAAHFIKRLKTPVDELKVLKLILYHDVVEIETGDVNVLDDKNRVGKPETEAKAAKVLAGKIPTTISSEFLQLFKEYEECNTPEAKFASAIDKIEPLVHWACYTEDWTKAGWNADILIKKKRKYLEPFPEILEFFDAAVVQLKRKGCF